MPLELLAPARSSERTAYRIDLGFATIGGILATAMVALVAGGLLALGTLVDGGPLGFLPGWAALPLGLIVFELAGYAYHRAAHRMPGLRRLHDVHHSSESMDWLAGFRQHPVEIALQTLAQNLPLVLLGLPLGQHAALAMILRLNTLFVHANVETPAWLGAFVATPRFHHRHHARDLPPANYATLFPWLDRVLGTYGADEGGPFGLPDGEHQGLPGWLVP